MAEHRPLTRQERERLHTRIHANVERALAEYDDDDWADMCMRGLGYILRYEATVAALEAKIARLRETLEEAVDEASDGIVDPSIISCWRDALKEGNADG